MKRLSQVKLVAGRSRGETKSTSTRPGRPVRREILRAPMRASAAAATLFANSFAALIGTRGKFKGTRWARAQGVHGTVPTLRRPGVDQGRGELIPALSELFVFLTWAMFAHTEPDTLRQETHEEKTLCQFPNGALWQPALPC